MKNIHNQLHRDRQREEMAMVEALLPPPSLPQRFLCGLTGLVMVDPVSIIWWCRHSFDRHEIKRLWIEHKSKSKYDGGGRSQSAQWWLWCLCPNQHCQQPFDFLTDISSNFPVQWEILYVQRRCRTRGSRSSTTIRQKDEDERNVEEIAELMGEFDLMHDITSSTRSSMVMEHCSSSTRTSHTEDFQSVLPLDVFPPQYWKDDIETYRRNDSAPSTRSFLPDNPPSMPRRWQWKDDTENYQRNDSFRNTLRSFSPDTPPSIPRRWQCKNDTEIYIWSVSQHCSCVATGYAVSMDRLCFSFERQQWTTIIVAFFYPTTSNHPFLSDDERRNKMFDIESKVTTWEETEWA